MLVFFLHLLALCVVSMICSLMAWFVCFCVIYGIVNIFSCYFRNYRDSSENFFFRFSNYVSERVVTCSILKVYKRAILKDTFWEISLIHGSKHTTKLTKELRIDYISFLQSKVHSPPYCCALLLDPRCMKEIMV